MLLIDAIYICTGGGLRLLNYLLESLNRKGIDYHLLCDSRCEKDFCGDNRKTVLKASFVARYKYYYNNRDRFSLVLCFANVPTPVKLKVPVYTYFHNINLLTLDQTNGKLDYMLSWLKRQVFRLLKRNTDLWIVQTTNTKKELVKHLDEDCSKVIIHPFYDFQKASISMGNPNSRRDYLFVGDYYKGAKGHNELLDAWALLHDRGFDFNLHLTVGYSNEKVCKRIELLASRGVHVINHGTIPFCKVIELYAQSKAIVYPSHNESLGLGIIEAINYGVDVIGANLPYIHAICRPSIVFKPYSPESIADAIIEYEKGMSIKSELIIYNHIDELLELITMGVKKNEMYQNS